MSTFHPRVRDYSEFYRILSGIQNEEHVQEMKQYIQHGRISTYEHCENVAKLCYDINRILPVHADLMTLLTGAMLHDFFLYDWHYDDDGTHSLHGFTHANRARMNARKYFRINEEIGHVIYCHMWPLNPERIPRSREAWLVCLADKYVSLQETLFRRKAR